MPSEQSHQCDLCGRIVAKLTRHHLVPRSRVRKRRRRNQTELLPEDPASIAQLCSPCHRMIHAVLSERELERDYPTIEALLAHEEISRFVAWIRKRGDAHIAVRWTRSRRDSSRRRP